MKRARSLLLAACVLCHPVPASAGAPTDAPPTAAPPGRPTCTGPAVETVAGAVCGLALTADAADGSGNRPVTAFLGIPYAQSTAGANRWKPPLPAPLHEQTLAATAYGLACPQHEPSPKKAPQGEDCLGLNIWTPKAVAGSGLPVMVYLHGGSFVGDSGALPVFDGARLAASGRVVVVTINYRLGALGFLAGTAGLTGNYGFLDQQAALRWVRDNIGAFGGDPRKVTLVGESAGAMSVGLHLAAPGSRDLFRAAIMESNPYGIPFKTLDTAGEFAGSLRLAAGCVLGGLDCLEEISAADIVAKQASVMLAVDTALIGFAGEVVWSPVIDGGAIPTQPLSTPIDKPVLIGTNRDEGVVFASGERIALFGTPQIYRVEYDALIDLFFPPAARAEIRRTPRYAPGGGDDTGALANVLTDYTFTCANRHVMEAATGPVFAYQFTHVPSFDVWPEVTLCAPDRKKVCHGFELPFVFGNPTTLLRELKPPGDAFTPAERALSETMAGYWISFAETLDPNHPGAPPWPAFTRDRPVRQILDTTISQATDLDANCAAWEAVGYDPPGIMSRIRNAF